MRIRIITVAFFLSIILTIGCIYWFDVFVVEGDSMSPSLKDGDVVLSIKTKCIKDDDIIIVDAKEIVGISDTEYIIKRYSEKQSLKGLYLEGDNEISSYDSDEFGEVPYYMFVGKVVLVYYR